MGKELQHYTITLHTEGPVFIGSGRTIGKKEYIYDRYANKVHIPNMEKMFAYFMKRGLLASYEEYLLNGKIDFVYWLKDNRITEREFMPWIAYTMDSGDAVIEQKSKKEILTSVKDAYGCPYVPGSSLKGKLRTLLARRSCVNGETLPDFSADGEVLLRMFGSSEPVRFARLQFADAFLLNYDQLKGVGVTEVKSENTINRLTSKANPRQIERVVAGSRFGVNIVYNLSDPKEMEEDLSLLSKAMKLLQLDYLGGHGSRGNGRVSFQNFQVIPYPETLNVDLDGIRQTFKTEVEEYELFSAKTGV